MSSENIEQFLRFVLKAPTGNTPDDIRERLDHWIEVANDPGRFTGADQSPFALKAMRRKARQNVRRLATRHPTIATQIKQEREAAQ